MLPEYYMDLLDDTGVIETSAMRCTECGNVIDSVILRNRAAAAPDLALGARERAYAQRVATGNSHKGKNGSVSKGQRARKLR